jgi:CO/xanthine dehydrogenase Mo-binding subunit
MPDSGGLSRRAFLGGVAGGLTVGVLLPTCKHVQGGQALGGGGFNPNAWLHVAADDTVTFFLDRAEMGQGVFTSHVQVLCEELELAPDKVKVTMAPADFRRYGVQITGGSTSTTASFDALRKAGATARELLRRAAAETWGVGIDEVQATDGALTHAAHGRLTYGAVADPRRDAALEGAVSVARHRPAAATPGRAREGGRYGPLQHRCAGAWHVARRGRSLADLRRSARPSRRAEGQSRRRRRRRAGDPAGRGGAGRGPLAGEARRIAA